jgi:hypothetical protein
VSGGIGQPCGVGPTDVGSLEVVLRVEEEAWENFVAYWCPSQNPLVRVKERAAGAFYRWTTVATN